MAVDGAAFPGLLDRGVIVLPASNPT